MRSPTTAAAQRSLTLIVVCGCLISLISFGVRSSYGLFNNPMTEAHGWGRDVFALAIAIQNLVWGLGQPFAGGLADRYGPARVLVGGALLYAAGVILTPYSDAPWMLHLTAGVLVGLGLSGATFGIVLAGFARFMTADRRVWAAGIATASGSLGQFLFAPMAGSFIAGYGWAMALVLLGAFMLIVPLLSIALSGGQRPTSPGGHGDDLSLGQTLAHACGHPSYQLLVAGFFVCGFHVAFITVHLPPYLADLGLDPGLAAWSVALIGLFNIVGSYGSGVLAGRFPHRYILCFIYAGRAAVIALFIAFPVTPVSVLAFSAAMGILWLSTVPPTSGLVVTMFGARHLGTLFGIAFLSHQVGAFIGVWMGGVLYESTHSYDVVWWVSIALGVFAAVVHWPIRERAAQRLAPQGAE